MNKTHELQKILMLILYDNVGSKALDVKDVFTHLKDDSISFKLFSDFFTNSHHSKVGKLGQLIDSNLTIEEDFLLLLLLRLCRLEYLFTSSSVLFSFKIKPKNSSTELDIYKKTIKVDIFEYVSGNLNAIKEKIRNSYPINENGKITQLKIEKIHFVKFIISARGNDFCVELLKHSEDQDRFNQQQQINADQHKINKWLIGGTVFTAGATFIIAILTGWIAWSTDTQAEISSSVYFERYLSEENCSHVETISPSSWERRYIVNCVK